jgi:hypothetical protein
MSSHSIDINVKFRGFMQLCRLVGQFGRQVGTALSASCFVFWQVLA